MQGQPKIHGKSDHKAEYDHSLSVNIFFTLQQSNKPGSVEGEASGDCNESD
jgi:hypothetical protein